MPPPPPDADADGGGVCVYVISFLLFLLLVSGGILLFLYIMLPFGQAPSWYPAAGLALVAAPWLFWILTCLYRVVAPHDSPAPPAAEKRRPPVRPEAIPEEPEEEERESEEGVRAVRGASSSRESEAPLTYSP